MPSRNFIQSPGNGPYQQIVDQVLKGLQDGTIVVQSVDVYQDMVTGTSYTLELLDTKGFSNLLPHSNMGYDIIYNKDGEIEQKKRILEQGFSDDPVTGYRDFDIKVVGDRIRLGSRNQAMWPPREAMRALCQDRPFADHDVPNEDCTCGIYAYDTPEVAMDHGGGQIWGEIAMWGDVLICETGYRSEFAYPTALFVPDMRTKTVNWMRDTLERTYGCPVFLVDARQGKSAMDLIAEALASNPVIHMSPEDLDKVELVELDEYGNEVD
jgi:hypothetical protein